LVYFFSLGTITSIYLTLTVKNNRFSFDGKISQRSILLKQQQASLNHYYKLQQLVSLLKPTPNAMQWKPLKTFVYAESEYFWINDYNAIM